MFRELLRSDHGSPTISQTVDTTRVAFVGGGAPRTQVVRFVEQLAESERDDLDMLLVVLTMLTEGSVTAAEIGPIVQKSEHEAEAVMRRCPTTSGRFSNRPANRRASSGPSTGSVARPWVRSAAQSGITVELLMTSTAS